MVSTFAELCKKLVVGKILSLKREMVKEYVLSKLSRLENVAFGPFATTRKLLLTR